jgi:ATP-dependent Lhr-like helicase
LTRRAGDPGQHGALDANAIARVRDEERPSPRDADELHDAMATAVFLTPAEVAELDPQWIETLMKSRRVTALQPAVVHPVGGERAVLWIAAERLPVFRAIDASLTIRPAIEVPASRADRVWSRDEAIVEVLRGRMAIVGPTTAAELAASCWLAIADVESALLAIEADGAALRGRFETRDDQAVQWCDRRLLARIHRYTLNRLRAEIEPVAPADFMRFLFAWQHVSPLSRLTGPDGLREAIEQLNGFEAPAASWERAILPSRVEPYDGPMLDMLCLTGEVAWARTSPPAPDVSGIVGATPIALFPREHAATWSSVPDANALEESARAVAEFLRLRGASFAHELAAGCGLDGNALQTALARLVAAGVVTSDGFGGLRSLFRTPSGRPAANGRPHVAGRWSLVPGSGTGPGTGSGTGPGTGSGTGPGPVPEPIVAAQARALLKRYGVVCRRMLTREPGAAPWRDLARMYRTLEARGEIRGGRFVTGLSGEQFALPEAVERLRETRRTAADGRVVTISAADPLNLAGIITAGERVRAQTSTRIAYCDGVPIAVLEGDFVRPLTDVPPAVASHLATALAGRPVPPVISGYVGRN